MDGVEDSVGDQQQADYVEGMVSAKGCEMLSAAQSGVAGGGKHSGVKKISKSGVKMDGGPSAKMCGEASAQVHSECGARRRSTSGVQLESFSGAQVHSEISARRSSTSGVQLESGSGAQVSSDTAVGGEEAVVAGSSGVQDHEDETLDESQAGSVGSLEVMVGDRMSEVSEVGGSQCSGQMYSVEQIKTFLDKTKGKTVDVNDYFSDLEEFVSSVQKAKKAAGLDVLPRTNRYRLQKHVTSIRKARKVKYGMISGSNCDKPKP